MICSCAVGSAADSCWWRRSHPSQHQGGTVRRLGDVQTQVCCPETSPLLQEVHCQRSVMQALAQSFSQLQRSADIVFLRTCRHSAKYSGRSIAQEGRAPRPQMSDINERTVGVPYSIRCSKTAKAAWISRICGTPSEPAFQLSGWSDSLILLASGTSMPCNMAKQHGIDDDAHELFLGCASRA